MTKNTNCNQSGHYLSPEQAQIIAGVMKENGYNSKRQIAAAINGTAEYANSTYDSVRVRYIAASNGKRPLTMDMASCLLHLTNNDERLSFLRDSPDPKEIKEHIKLLDTFDLYVGDLREAYVHLSKDKAEKVLENLECLVKKFGSEE